MTSHAPPAALPSPATGTCVGAGESKSEAIRRLASERGIPAVERVGGWSPIVRYEDGRAGTVTGDGDGV